MLRGDFDDDVLQRGDPRLEVEFLGPVDLIEALEAAGSPSGHDRPGVTALHVIDLEEDLGVHGQAGEFAPPAVRKRILPSLDIAWLTGKISARPPVTVTSRQRESGAKSWRQRASSRSVIGLSSIAPSPHRKRARGVPQNGRWVTDLTPRRPPAHSSAFQVTTRGR